MPRYFYAAGMIISMPLFAAFTLMFAAKMMFCHYADVTYTLARLPRYDFAERYARCHLLCFDATPLFYAIISPC